MQKFFRWIMLLAAVAVSGAVNVHADGTAPRKGVVRVKLQAEVARQVGVKPRMQAAGVLETGVTPLDRAARQVRAVKMKRMIPYSAKNANKHAQFGLDRWYEVEFDETVSVEQARKIFGTTAGVEIAEAIRPMSLIEDGQFKTVGKAPLRAAAGTMPFNDPRLPEQWHYSNPGTIPYSVKGADANIFDAWRVTTGNPNVLVAIIDGGVDYKHEDLAANMFVNEAELNGTPGVDDDGNGYVDDVYGFNFCTNTAEVYPHSHGTHVAGTVGAVNGNGIGVAGVAGGDGTPGSGVRMISCQVFESRSGVPDANFAAALVYAADMGASIAQCSWGWDSPGYKEQAVLDAIDYFTESSRTPVMNGGLCIFAAGNTGQTGDYYPGAYEPVVAVAAMTAELTPASYSTNGAWVDVTAPGGLLDYGQAQGVLSTLPNNEYGYNEGTSMATPHVSGIAALVLSKYGSPTFVNESLRTQLLTSVNDLYGVPGNEGARGRFGSGYIDAGKALAYNTEGTPEAVTDMTLQAGQDYIQVQWTIPAAADNNVNNHIIYYSTTPFTAADDLTKVKSAVVDTKFMLSGQTATHELQGLQAMTTYYVAMVAVNRWGGASELSAVKSVTTNAGPVMTAEGNVTLATTAASPVQTGTFSVGNTGEGLLKWQAAKRTVSAQMRSVARPQVSASPYRGSLAHKSARKAPPTALAEYEAADNPQEIAYYDMLWANIGDTDKSLPNSMAQWFYVDPAQYPDGFNLTAIQAEGNGGNNPVVQIYKGDVAISSATLLQTVDYMFWAYNYPVTLSEQLYFAPGESFWVVIHFDANQEGYPLGMGLAPDNSRANSAYMSNDMGQTWTQLTAALKGSPYEANADQYVWAIRARSLNPDWSQALELSPASGTVAPGETQTVEVKADGTKFVNGSYKMNVKLTGNQPGNPELTVPVELTVAGNPYNVVMPKVVNFGNLLVGQSKTVVVEAYNKGYGSFRGSQWGADIWSDGISSSSEHFSGPDYVQGGFAARTATRFELTYHPTAEGSHTGTITFTGADGSAVRVLVQGSATEPAHIAIEPAAIDAGTLTVGAEPTKATFTVSNTGKYPLEFVFPKYSDEQIEGNTAASHKFGYNVFSTLPGFNAMEYTAPEALIGATDIAGKFSDAVYVSEAIDPGFTFPYYGHEYNRLYITSYGGIMFAANPENFWAPLTETSTSIAGTGLISAYGRQLQFTPQSRVEYARQDGKFVVNFSNVEATVYDTRTMPVSFRIILSANGDIEMYYDDINAASTFQSGSTLFCGINDPEMADQLTLTSADMADYWGNYEETADNSRYKLFNSGVAVKFQAPKASFVTAVTPAYGLLSPGESVEVTATMAADATMNAGATFNSLAVVSNDPTPVVNAVRIDAVIDGDALVAQPTVESDAISFGDVMRSAVVRIPVTVRNAGKRDLTITGATLANGLLTVETQLPVTVAGGMGKDIVIAVPTATEGQLADILTIATTAGDLTVAISGTVVGCPTADITPAAFDETVESGQPLVKTLTVANNGNAALTYAITPDNLVALDVPETDDTRVSYTWQASVDDASVKQPWIDIETTGLGTQTTFSQYNMHDYITVELPFEFSFYGHKYTKMYVYNTGFVSFTQRHDDKLWPEPPADFPQGTVYDNLIAPYWGLHSMDITKTAGTYHYVTDDHAVVSFMEYGNSMNLGVCYQLVLYRDGSFSFQYKGANENSVIFGPFGLAGISSPGGEQSIRLPERMIQFDNYVSFKPVKENTLAAGQSVDIPATFSTARMGGVYNTTLQVATNVPGKESVEIPVQLTVQGVAQPVFPQETIVVEHTAAYMSTDYSNPLVALGAPYDAPFTVANQGTAAFTILQAECGGPQIYDEWFDEYGPAFWLFAEAPAIDWITGEPTGEYMWDQYNGMPVEITDRPMAFSVPMMQNDFWMTPGEYEVPVTFVYVPMSMADYSAALDAGTEVIPQEAVVNVKFIVTPVPAMSIDKTEVYVHADSGDHQSTEVITLGNEGEYKLVYDLWLDPTGVGEVQDPDQGGGIAPWSNSRLTAESKELLKGMLKAQPKPMATSTNAYDTPQDVEYTNALFYPAMPGNNAAYNYGAQTEYDVFKAATSFVAPAEGFNISHVYLPVVTEGKTDYEVNLKVIAGNDPAGETVLGRGRLLIDSQRGGTFYLAALEKPVYMNPGEEFCLVAEYAAGVNYPAYLCAKEEAVVNGRYMGWTEGYGWFDVGDLFNDQYGSLGFIMTCIETAPGQPWVKLLDTPAAGEVAPGESATLKLAVNAASARLEKDNRAMLVLHTNDPNVPVLNIPVVLDLNGKPVIDAPASTILVNEGEQSTVAIGVYDPDGDEVTVTVEDPAGVATLTDYTDGTATVTLAPEFGQGGMNFAFVVNVVDSKGAAATADVRYTVVKVNRAPVAVEVKPVKVVVDKAGDVINFADLFYDPDGDELTFHFEMADNSVADAYTTATGVVFVGKQTGNTTATVTATDPEGLTATVTLPVEVTDASGVDDIIATQAGKLVSLLENPVVSDLRLLANTDSNLRLTLVDGAGQTVALRSLRATFGEVITMPVGHLSAGLYLLQVTDGTDVQTLRVIKR